MDACRPQESRSYVTGLFGVVSCSRVWRSVLFSREAYGAGKLHHAVAPPARCLLAALHRQQGKGKHRHAWRCLHLLGLRMKWGGRAVIGSHAAAGARSGSDPGGVNQRGARRLVQGQAGTCFISHRRQRDLCPVSLSQTRTSLSFLTFKLAMDFIQLFLLCVNPAFGYNIDRSNMCGLQQSQDGGVRMEGRHPRQNE